jgi:anti-anti-sigma factor
MPPAPARLRKSGADVDSRKRADEAVHHETTGQVRWARGLAARELIDGGAGTIYVDLGGVTFMGSNLVGFLVQVGNAVSDARRHLVLCRPTPMARKVIHVTGLELFASVHVDVLECWPDIALLDSAAHLSA